MLDTIESAIEDIKNGKIIIVVDDEDRENEGDFIIASHHVTPEVINFMSKYGRGLICIALLEDRCSELGLELMVNNNTALHETAFTVSVDLLGHGCTTGISAQDRSKTVKSLIDPLTNPEDLGRPGHIFPLRAKKDGSMARLPELLQIAEKFDFKVISIKDLIEYRIKRDSLIEEIVRVDMPFKFGHFKLIAFKEKNSSNEHLALIKGEWQSGDAVMVRVHSSCFTGDILGSLRCDCGDQLHHAMQMVEAEGNGVILYMNQEGRGIGLLNKLKAYRLQEQGMDTVEANLHLGFQMDQRDYGVGAQILRHLGISKIRLLTNNPKKRVGLIGYGLEIVDNIPLKINANAHNEKYLQTKRDKLGHEILKD